MSEAPNTANALLVRIREIRDARDVVNKQLSALDGELKEAEKNLLDYMEEHQLDITAVKGVGTATRSKKEVANVTDWDAFGDYVIKNNAIYLLQRRVSNGSVLELMADSEVPGVEYKEFPALGFRRTN